MDATAEVTTAPAGRPLHQRLNRWMRRLSARLLNRARPGPVVWPPPAEIRRILVIRANYRLGNIVIATALLPVLRAVYPQATIDFLVGEGPAPLLAGLPLGRVHLLSRRWLRTPWKAVRLWRELRGCRYDLALDGSLESFSGSLYGWLSGARHRAGAQGKADRLLTLPLPVPAGLNGYGTAPWLASQLGVNVTPETCLQVTPAAREDARTLLASLGFSRQAGPLLAVFVGGHHEKRWPAAKWRELLQGLAGTSWQTLVLVGPEERELVAVMQAAAKGPVRVLPPQSLTRCAALLAECDRLITPDSGPLHIAAALGVPVLVLLQHPRSLRFMPPGVRHRSLLRPEVPAVLQELAEKPAPTAAAQVQT